MGEGSPYKSPHTGGHQDWCEACLTWIRSELMTELELYIQLMTVYLYDNFLFLRQILTLMCQITSEGYFSGNFRSPGGSCQLWLAHPCTQQTRCLHTRPCGSMGVHTTFPYRGTVGIHSRLWPQTRHIAQFSLRYSLDMCTKYMAGKPGGINC